MNSPALLPDSNQITEHQLVYWPKLSVAEQAFVAAYIKNNYSLPDACSELKVTKNSAQTMLQSVAVRRAITEVQSELDGIDFLNERWVKAQLLRLFPMVMGDEPVPYITPQGDEAEGRKFDAASAIKIIDYVAPRTTAGKAAGNNTAVQVNIDLGAFGIQKIEVNNG